MIEDIEILQKETNEIYTILKELGKLETGEGADYSGVIADISWNKLMLKNRLQTLRRRQQC